MTNVISVRFRNGSKTYYFDPKGTVVAAGQDVIVETAQGLEFAQCVQGNHDVPDDAVVSPLRPLIRIATDNDRHTAAYNRSREKEAYDICQKKILQHKLEMKLVRAECSFDGNKILFFFTADGRVDFRELVKDLASVFRARIELRQIGVRDEAKMLGGLGICGRPFCCSQYMDDFLPVSIKMAKTQNLSLNPAKISGTCGRLMCCLKYEQDAYEDAVKHLPKNDSFVLTPDGPGNVCDVNLLKEMVTVRLDDSPENGRCYHNCEVCVLRNGKGSRDGIVIPDKRPERYVEEEEVDDVPILISDFTPAEPIGDSMFEKKDAGEKRHRNRHRRGKNRSDASKPEETKSSSVTEDATPEKKSGERSGSNNARRRRNRNRSGNNTQQAKKPAAQTNSTAQENPQANSTAENGTKHRRNHRGGRRHRNHRGGNGSAPKSEA